MHIHIQILKEPEEIITHMYKNINLKCIVRIGKMKLFGHFISLYYPDIFFALTTKDQSCYV